LNGTGNGVRGGGKTRVFNRQLVSTHYHLMYCEITTVGLKLPEVGVNKH
jgi:hypothetical protein